MTSCKLGLLASYNLVRTLPLKPSPFFNLSSLPLCQVVESCRQEELSERREKKRLQQEDEDRLKKIEEEERKKKEPEASTTPAPESAGQAAGEEGI